MSIRMTGRFTRLPKLKIHVPTDIVVVPVEPSYPEWIIGQGYLGSFAEGTDLDLELTASDPDGDIETYQVVSGTLPPGISLNLYSGHLLGTFGNIASTTSYSFRVKVKDSTGLELFGDFEIQVQNVATQVVWQTDEGTIAEPGAGETASYKVTAVSQ